jgi:hypothetical protein
MATTVHRLAALVLVPTLAVQLLGCGHDQSETPTAIDQTIAMPQGESAANTLDAQDLGSGTPSYVILQQPLHGTVQVDPTTGTFIYTPAASYLGTDSFTWQVSDGDGTSGAAEVSIQVVAPAA